MVTPLRDVDALDIAGLEKLIEHILAGGVSALFILGTTGEFSGLSYCLRHDLVERVCRIVNKRVQVLVGISDTSLVESVELANKAADFGADAVVATPPYYFSAGQPELIDYYQRLILRLPLPLYLYNMPFQTKVSLHPDTVKIIADHKNVIGFKDSSADAVYFNLIIHAMRDRKEFSLFVGPELMTAEAVLMGGHGGVNGGANIFPRLYVDLYNAAAERNISRMLELQEKIREINATIYTVGKYNSSIIKGIKCALSLMGICEDIMTEPFVRFKKEDRDKVKKHLEALAL
jgi:4-hydroxy-tetrahydrodipicolinate synthase